MDSTPDLDATVVIVGGGAAGITVAAEMRRHRPGLDVMLVDPATIHSYQPGWTLVGAGVFSLAQTTRREETLIPPGVTWVRSAVTAFDPAAKQVRLADGRHVGYRSLVVCPGLAAPLGQGRGLTRHAGAERRLLELFARPRRIHLGLPAGVHAAAECAGFHQA